MISRLYLRGVLADLTGPRDPDLPPNRLRFVGAGDFRAVGDEIVLMNGWSNGNTIRKPAARWEAKTRSVVRCEA